VTSPTRVVFLGSGGFAVPILEALAADPTLQLVGVVSTPPRPAGRAKVLGPTPVASRAMELGVPVLLPERLRDPAAAADIAALEPDLLVLADYGRIVPSTLLDLAPHGALNLHPSLLPRHRGATPIPAAIGAADAETGVSLIRMDAGIDTGPIVAQLRVPLQGDEDTPGLEARLSQAAARLLIGCLPGWLDGTLPAAPQPTHGATLTKPFRKEDGRLDPARTAAELERQVRALRPWPGTFLERADGRILVWSARVSDAPVPPGVAVGDLGLVGRDLALVTRDGSLVLADVQPAGGKRMSGAELARGRPAILSATGGSSPAVPGVER
jgi:methionyl-tRNA formyltransferase